jgi:hypothetical protein
VWTARGLNLISANNQAASRMLAGILVLRAWDKTLDSALVEVQKARIEAAEKIALGGKTGNFLLVLQGYLDLRQAETENDTIAVIRGRLSKPAIGLLAGDRDGALWSAMRAMQFFSAAVADRIGWVAQVRAFQLGRYNTGGDGVAMLMWPGYLADPGTPTRDATGNAVVPGSLPVRIGQFTDFAAPTLSGRPPGGGIGRPGPGGAGPFAQMRGASQAFCAIALPRTTHSGRDFRQFAAGEVDYVFTNPGPQAWMPAPFALADDLAVPVLAVPGGQAARRLGVWSAAAIGNHAPFWAHRFMSATPGSLAFAFARAKVVNAVSWDLWSPDWRAKLTHADFTYDRSLYGANAVAPQELAGSLLSLLQGGRFDTFRSAAGLRGTTFPGSPVPAGEAAAGLDVLARIARSGLPWDATVGQSLLTH